MPRSARYSDCPSHERLSELLNDTTPLDSTIADHVDCCDSCQRSLDALLIQHPLESYRQNLERVTSFPAAPVSPEMVKVDGFELQSEIGRGGMGVVYRALDKKLDRAVAIKLLSRTGSFEQETRFERESKAAARINHPNVVRVFHSGRALDGRPFLVMPLIEGNTLRERLQGGPLEPNVAANVVRQIASGLASAHQFELIHRDVKSVNILLDDSDGLAKLTDFGLVRTQSDRTLTGHDLICGTPEYMSPEQAIDPSTTDVRTDVYSLGVVMYECLTGTIPFRGRPLDVLAQHRRQDIVPPRQLNRTIPRDLETICLKALEKEPDRRYASASSFANDLQNFLSHRPIAARPTSKLYKAWRWAKRNQRVSYLATALACSLIVGISLVIWQWQVASRNYQESKKNYEIAQQNFDAATELVVNRIEFVTRLEVAGQELAAFELTKQLTLEVEELARMRPNDPGIQIVRFRLYYRNAVLACCVADRRVAIDWFKTCEQTLQELQNKSSSFGSTTPYWTRDMSELIQLSHGAATALLKGEAYQQLGEIETALSEYDKAKIQLMENMANLSGDKRANWHQRNFVLVMVMEGQAWNELGKTDRALQSYEAASRVLPERTNHKAAFPFLPLYENPGRNSPFVARPEGESARHKLTSHRDHIRAYVAHFLGRHLVNHEVDPKRKKQGTDLLKYALETRRSISADSPDFIPMRRDIALTLTELAKLDFSEGDSRSGMKKIDEAIEILMACIRDSDRLENNLFLAQSLVIRAEHLLSIEKLEEADSDLRRAVESARSVLEKSPEWLECQRVLEKAESMLGELQTESRPTN